MKSGGGHFPTRMINSLCDRKLRKVETRLPILYDEYLSIRECFKFLHSILKCFVLLSIVKLREYHYQNTATTNKVNTLHLYRNVL